jgi:hypothetical protein
MTTRSNGDLHLADPVHTPAPAPAITPQNAVYGPVLNEWFEQGFENFIDPVKTEIDVGVTTLLDERDAKINEQIKSLEREVAELKGAMDVMRSLGHAGLRMRGSYDAAEAYLRHDIVTREGSSFIALKDKPGGCPGGDWELLASKGNRGPAGPHGPRGMVGARGAPAPPIKAWLVDRKAFTASPVLTSGEVGAALELRGLFQEFLDQTAPRAGR